MNWNHYENSDIRGLLDLSEHETIELDHVEEFAKYSHMIASEEQLSDLFDENVLPHVLETYREDDSIAISEAFNDWSDILCKDGELHPLQYDAYCYVGRLARD